MDNNKHKIKIIRISTIPLSLDVLLKGQLQFLSNYFDIIGISSAEDTLNKVEVRENIRTIGINMERSIRLLKDLISLYRLYICLKREKPIIIHSITPKAGLLSMLAGKMAGVPIRMHTFTGLVFPTRSGIMQKLLIKMDQLLCYAATNIYPEGEGVKNDLIKYKITSKPLKVLANGNVNGINLDFFNPQMISKVQQLKLRQELNISNKDFVFIFIGRLVRDKGINELVNVFSQLKEENLKLILVGNFEPELDPLSPSFLQEIENNPNILSVGYQNDVRLYLSIADTLVFPSYREGFPNVVMQAGAMGLPSIVTDINGCNEIIIEGINGLIIPPKNTDALRNAMMKVYQDTELRKKLTQNARSLISSRFEQKMVWNALLEEYNTLLKEKELE